MSHLLLAPGEMNFFFLKFLVAGGYSMMATSPVGFASHQNPIIVLEEVASSDEI
jgi:hypothetical protein